MVLIVAFGFIHWIRERIVEWLTARPESGFPTVVGSSCTSLVADYLSSNTVSNASHEVLAIPGETISANARLSNDDTQLFFLHGKTTSNIWLMRFPGASSK